MQILSNFGSFNGQTSGGDSFIDRLAMSKDIELISDLFDIFAKQITQIIQTRTDISLEDIILMKGSLINFSLKKIPNNSKREDSINLVINNALNVIKEKNQTIIPLRNNLGKELGTEADPKWQKKCQKIFQFLNQTIGSLMKDSQNCWKLCLKLFLLSAQNVSKTQVDNRETIAYDFCSQAFVIYEEEIHEYKTQLFCLLLIISTILDIGFTQEDNYRPLKSQCCLNVAKLVKKSDQIRAILSASLLFINFNQKRYFSFQLSSLQYWSSKLKIHLMALKAETIASPTKQQEKLLEESLNVVEIESYKMKRFLSEGETDKALIRSLNMFSNLTTNELSLKSYYELYMSITNQLSPLENYLLVEFQNGVQMGDLYGAFYMVGESTRIFYLRITLVLAYMNKVTGFCKQKFNVLFDMCKGVEDPLQQLFLRHYLLQTCQVFPTVTEDIGSGCVQDSIDFILLNFAEINKLWVRMQHIGHTREDRREKKIFDLIFRTNLDRLSELKSVDLKVYKNDVLPRILEQVVSCLEADPIVQEYLMESLIQVFPDEFHLATLQPFLNSCAQLTQNVNVNNIIIALIDRLAMSKDIELPSDLFDIFAKQITQIIKTRTDISLEDIILMNSSLIRFSLKKIPNNSKREDSINLVIDNVLNVIKEKNQTIIPLRNNLGKELFKFLKLPFNFVSVNGQTSGGGLSPIKMSLKLKAYKDLLKDCCAHDLHKEVTLTLINRALDNFVVDSESDRLSLEEMEVFLSEICDPLISGKNKELDVDENDKDFIDEQQLLSRFIHFMFLPQCLENSTELDNYYILLTSVSKCLSIGGPKRIRYTYPSLVFEALNLSLKYSKAAKESNTTETNPKCQEIYKFVDKTIGSLLKDSQKCWDLCLKLFQQSAQNFRKTRIDNRETIDYDFCSKEILSYLKDLVDSDDKDVGNFINQLVKKIEEQN